MFLLFHKAEPRPLTIPFEAGLEAPIGATISENVGFAESVFQDDLRAETIAKNCTSNIYFYYIFCGWQSIDLCSLRTVCAVNTVTVLIVSCICSTSSVFSYGCIIGKFIKKIGSSRSTHHSTENVFC